MACLALVAGAAWDGVFYYGLTREVAAQQQGLLRYERQMAGLADVAKMLEAADKRRNEIDAGLTEVSQVLALHRAWSPALAALAENAPKGIAISEVMAKREEKKNTQQKGKYDYSLLMGVTAPSGPAAVEQFIQALRSALPLRPGADPIRIISQRQQQVEGRDVQHYVIECRLKP